MKKFLTISMMALAMVLASSCNKDENPEESNNSKYVNTWVAENVAVSEVLEDLDGTTIDEILGSLPETVKNQIATKKVNAIVKFDGNGKGNAGVLLDTELLGMMKVLIASLPAQGITVPEEVTVLLNSLKANDCIGITFDYTATPADATKGKFEFAVTVDGKTEKTDVDYTDLSDDSITISYTEDSQTYKYTLKSLSSTKLTVNNFIDVMTLAGLLPGTDE